MDSVTIAEALAEGIKAIGSGSGLYKD